MKQDSQQLQAANEKITQTLIQSTCSIQSMMEKNYPVKHLQQSIGLTAFHYCFQWTFSLVYILAKVKKKILLISTLFSGLCCSWDLIISQEVIGIGHSAFVITLSSNCHFQKALNSKWHIQGTREATEYHSISHVLPLVFADSMKRDYCDSEDRWQNIVHIPKYQLQQGWTMSAELCWSTSLSTGGLENSSSSTTGTANS